MKSSRSRASFTITYHNAASNNFTPSRESPQTLSAGTENPSYAPTRLQRWRSRTVLWCWFRNGVDDISKLNDR